MTTTKLRTSFAAIIAALAVLAASTAPATAYQSAEHGTNTAYKHLVPGNSGWAPIVLKRGLTD